ncbi:hypothetical protein Gotur_035750 [Gossypium turneri]
MFPEPRRDRNEPRAPSKGKGKKHTSIGSSSGRRSSSSNLGYSDSSTNTQGTTFIFSTFTWLSTTIWLLSTIS